MKDYKPRPRAKPTSIGNTLLGIFIGLLLGLLVASAIAIYMMKSPFPWSSKRQADRAAESKAEGAQKGAPEDSKAAKTGGDKPHLDFYHILTGPDNAGAPAPQTAKSDSTTKSDASKSGAAKSDAGKSDTAATVAKVEPARPDTGKADAAKGDTPGRFVLQAGSFQNPAEADTVKAKLALMGLEANIETVDLPDRGTWYRVRMGPYRSLDEVKHIRSQLAQSGIDASLVRNNPSP